jgi:P-type Mg2+ transporter
LKRTPEDVFHRCSQFELDGQLSPMEPDRMVGLKAEYDSLSNDGFRVLAVTTKDLSGKQL